jgi:hypothetical protein
MGEAMKIVLNMSENDARLSNPKGSIVISINGNDQTARVAVYSDISSHGILEKVDSRVPVEVEGAEGQPSGFLLDAKRKIRLED